jgi:hypothetical protein
LFKQNEISSTLLYKNLVLIGALIIWIGEKSEPIKVTPSKRTTKNPPKEDRPKGKVKS